MFAFFPPQVQDKFRLDLTDEEAVQYLQSLIDESVSAMLPVVVEQFHKMAQVSRWYICYLISNQMLGAAALLLKKFSET